MGLKGDKIQIWMNRAYIGLSLLLRGEREGNVGNVGQPRGKPHVMSLFPAPGQQHWKCSP